MMNSLNIYIALIIVTIHLQSISFLQNHFHLVTPSCINRGAKYLFLFHEPSTLSYLLMGKCGLIVLIPCRIFYIIYYICNLKIIQFVLFLCLSLCWVKTCNKFKEETSFTQWRSASIFSSNKYHTLYLILKVNLLKWIVLIHIFIMYSLRPGVIFWSFWSVHKHCVLPILVHDTRLYKNSSHLISLLTKKPTVNNAINQITMPLSLL